MTPWNRDAEASDFAQAVKESLEPRSAVSEAERQHKSMESHPDAVIAKLRELEARQRRVITRAIRAGEDLLLMLAEAKLKMADALEELRRL